MYAIIEILMNLSKNVVLLAVPKVKKFSKLGTLNLYSQRTPSLLTRVVQPLYIPQLQQQKPLWNERITMKCSVRSSDEYKQIGSLGENLE